MQGRDKAYAHKNVVVEFLFFVVHDKKKKRKKSRSPIFVISRCTSTNSNHENLLLSILNKFWKIRFWMKIYWSNFAQSLPRSPEFTRYTYIYSIYAWIRLINDTESAWEGIIFDEANMSIKETRSKRSIEMNSWSRHFFRRSCLSAKAIRWRTLWFDPEDWIRGNSFALLFLPSDFASIKAKLKR